MLTKIHGKFYACVFYLTFIIALTVMKEQANWISLLLFSHSVVLDSLWPHELQHARFPCFSLSPRVWSNSRPLSRWHHPTISFCLPLFLPSIFPRIKIFSNESTLCIRWPKYWSFSFSIRPYNEYSGLISFSIDWFDLLDFRGLINLLLQAAL